MTYRCPVCHKPLIPDGKVFLCENSHCFDRAKQGYVNLLKSSAPRSHGDDAGMVAARTRFLDAGHYAPLAEALLRAIPYEARTVLDAGCGEGYYTAKLADAPPRRAVYGTDISKQAIISACRRTKKVFWSVSSVNDLPFADESFDALICVFSPLAKAEYRRVLKKNGSMLVVIPLEDHLWELKAAVYESPYPNVPSDPQLDGFSFSGREDVIYEAEIIGEQTIKDLFSMTPYSHNTAPGDAKKLEGIGSLKTKIAFGLLKYTKI